MRDGLRPLPDQQTLVAGRPVESRPETHLTPKFGQRGRDRDVPYCKWALMAGVRFALKPHEEGYQRSPSTPSNRSRGF